MLDAADIALHDGTLVGIARLTALFTAAQTRRDRAVVRRVAVHNL
jgi:hypothetical protein